MAKSKLDRAIDEYAKAKAHESKNTDKRKEDSVRAVKNVTKDVVTDETTTNKAVEGFRKAWSKNPNHSGMHQDKWNGFTKKGGRYGKKSK